MKYNIIVTFSKLTGFVLMLLSFSYSFYTKDSTILFMTLPIVAAMILGKQYFDKQNKTKINISSSRKQQQK